MWTLDQKIWRVNHTLTTGAADAVRSGRHRSDTALTEAVLSTEGDTIPSREGLSEKQRKRLRCTTQLFEKQCVILLFFSFTCKVCTQSMLGGRSSPTLWPPLPPQTPHSCCRACREASGSPAGRGSHCSSWRSRSELGHSHTLHTDMERQRTTKNIKVAILHFLLSLDQCVMW